MSLRSLVARIAAARTRAFRGPAAGALIVLLGLHLAGAVPAARAGSVSHTATFPLSPYLNSGTFNFAPAAIPKFDQAGQCLTSVCVRLDGGVYGEIGFENLQASPAIVNVLFTSSITLQRPDFSTLLFVQPATTTTDTVTSFDGGLDYGGTSGRSYTGVSATASDSLCITSGADLALFAGAGNVNLPGFAIDLSNQTGATSWSIGVRAYATVRVTYNYIDCVTPVRLTTWGGIKSLYR